MDKPSITEVVSRHIQLRKAGKEHVGRCPFHADKIPSLHVNEDKGLFHCFGCGESGDVMDFVMKLDGLTFPEAKRALGIESDGRRSASRVSPHRKAATLLATWLNEQHLLIGVRCRGLSRQIALADEIPGDEPSESLRRQWEILSDLHDDLVNPSCSAELWEQRTWIEQLTAGVELEPVPELPPLTESYRAYLRSVL
jgi:DNA primase